MFVTFSALVTTYLLNASVQESNILTSARVALRLKIDALELQVLQVLLQSSLLLVQLDALLTLGGDVLLHFLGKSLRSTHLAHGSGSNILLVSEPGLEFKHLAV